MSGAGEYRAGLPSFPSGAWRASRCFAAMEEPGFKPATVSNAEHLGLAYLAGALRRYGHHATIITASRGPDRGDDRRGDRIGLRPRRLLAGVAGHEADAVDDADAQGAAARRGDGVREDLATMRGTQILPSSRTSTSSSRETGRRACPRCSTVSAAAILTQCRACPREAGGLAARSRRRPLSDDVLPGPARTDRFLAQHGSLSGAPTSQPRLPLQLLVLDDADLRWARGSRPPPRRGDRRDGRSSGALRYPAPLVATTTCSSNGST